MTKKKILVFIDWYLPGFKAGGPIRSCANMIAHLSDIYDFYVITSDTDYTNELPYENVRKNDWNKLPDGSNVYYISKEKRNKNTIKRLLNEIEVDCYYLNGVYSYLFTQVPLKNIDRKRKKIIVATRGMLSPSALSIKKIKKKLFFFYAKLAGLFEGIIFHATTIDEKNQIENIFAKCRVLIAPNLPRKNKIVHRKPIVKSSGELLLLSIARIAPEKNLLYALEVLKNVKGRVAFDFYGPIYNDSYWHECQKMISYLPANITARYKGVVLDEEIFSVMENYHFLFLPSRGENFGHIILEAMSFGLPVIISDRTPWRRLSEKQAGFDVPLDKPAEFSMIIDECVTMSGSQYSGISSNASSLAEAFISDEEKTTANRLLFS